LAAKGQQPSGQVGGPLAGPNDLLEIVPEGIVGLTMSIQQKLGIAVDHGQQVVEIVGNAAGQPAHGFHFLGLAQLSFQLAALGQVPVHADAGNGRALLIE
jgi:hypothetical protein